MQNLFRHYMFERARIEKEEPVKAPGPVITISREYGCYGSEIAELLAERINAHLKPSGEHEQWFCVSHEVLHGASESLQASPKEIVHIFGAQEKTILEDLTSVFSKDKYLTNNHIKRTIARIVRSYAEQGRAIIVGRAGCVLANHIERAVHVRLMAPLAWRVERIRARFQISPEEAERMVRQSDKRREAFMRFYRGNRPASELFDLLINRATLTNQQIAEVIFRLALAKGLV